jgi:hypothetical protein
MHEVLTNNYEIGRRELEKIFELAAFFFAAGVLASLALPA